MKEGNKLEEKRKSKKLFIFGTKGLDTNTIAITMF